MVRGDAVLPGAEAPAAVNVEEARPLPAAAGVQDLNDYGAAAPPAEDEEEEEEEEASLHQDDEDIAMSRNDPRRMQLTARERDWALDIKEMVEGMPDLDDLSDMFYGQLAIITRGNMEEAMARCYGMQDFRQEYKIRNTYSEGCRYIERCFQLMPGQLLSFSFDDEAGTYIFAHDSTMLESFNLNTPDKVNDWLAGAFYMHTTYCPDFESIRKGVIVLAECDGWDWTKKQDFKIFQKHFDELLRHYPFNGEVRHFNSGMVFNIMVTMLKRLVPKEIGDRMKTGYKQEERMDTILLVPDRKSANRRMIENLQETLKKRYDNESTFRLEH